MDRFNRKWIIVGTDIVRGVIVLCVGLLFYVDAMNLGMILLAQVLISICSALFNPAIPAVIPQLVKKSQLGRANSQAQLIRGIALIVGPLLGGFSVAFMGYIFVFLFNAVSYLISAVFESFMIIPAKDDRHSSASLRDDIVKGFRHILHERGLVVLIATVAVIHFFVGAIQTITPVFRGNISIDLFGHT